MSKQHENTLARRQALQVLFQKEFLGIDLSTISTAEVEPLVVSHCPEGIEEADLVGEELSAYATQILTGIVDHLEDIDGLIASTAQNWTLERMLLVDRNIIRIATFEIFYCEDIPTGVAINEAVEVAKVFGGDDSPKFVNGVLGRIADKYDQDQAAQAQPEDVEE